MQPQEGSAYSQAGFFMPGFNAEEFEEGGKASPEPDDQLPFRKKRINTTLQQDRHHIAARTAVTPQPDAHRRAARPIYTPLPDRMRTEGFDGEGKYAESRSFPVSHAWELQVSSVPTEAITTLRPEDLMRSLQPEQLLTCTIRMDKGVFTTRYLVSLAPGSPPVLIAKKRIGRTPAEYLIAATADFRTVLAKLKSNFTGSQFLLYVPKKTNGGARNEIAIMIYSIGEKPDGYRKLMAYIPDFALFPHSSDLLDRVKSASLAGLHLYNTLPPTYSPGTYYPATRSYAFHIPSATPVKWSFKNFQLFQYGSEGYFAVQMVKTTPCTYQVAIRGPISPLQGVGIALSSIDHKILCD